MNISDNQLLRKSIKQKELIIQELKNKGCRITKQRSVIIDIILDNGCSCCKEIYYQANKMDATIGIATVYRMVKTLEDIGAIDRKNLYKISYNGVCESDEECMIMVKSRKGIHLTLVDWKEVLRAGLKSKGFINEEDIDLEIMKSCHA